MEDPKETAAEVHTFISLRQRSLRLDSFQFTNHRFLTTDPEVAEKLKTLISNLTGPLRTSVNYLGTGIQAKANKAVLDKTLNGNNTRPGNAIPAPGLRAPDNQGLNISRGPVTSGPISNAATLSSLAEKANSGVAGENKE